MSQSGMTVIIIAISQRDVRRDGTSKMTIFGSSTELDTVLEDNDVCLVANTQISVADAFPPRHTW